MDGRLGILLYSESNAITEELFSRATLTSMYEEVESTTPNHILSPDP